MIVLSEILGVFKILAGEDNAGDIKVLGNNNIPDNRDLCRLDLGY